MRFPSKHFACEGSLAFTTTVDSIPGDGGSACYTFLCCRPLSTSCLCSSNWWNIRRQRRRSIPLSPGMLHASFVGCMQLVLLGSSGPYVGTSSSLTAWRSTVLKVITDPNQPIYHIFFGPARFPRAVREPWRAAWPPQPACVRAVDASTTSSARIPSNVRIVNTASCTSCGQPRRSRSAPSDFYSRKVSENLPADTAGSGAIPCAQCFCVAPVMTSTEPGSSRQLTVGASGHSLSDSGHSSLYGTARHCIVRVAPSDSPATVVSGPCTSSLCG